MYLRMIHAITILMAFILLATWQANTDPDLAGYNFYYRLSGQETWVLLNASGLIPKTETSYSFNPPAKGELSFTVTAVDLAGNESDYSFEDWIFVRPNRVIGLSIRRE